jgi:Ribosomal_S17 N-terminal
VLGAASHSFAKATKKIPGKGGLRFYKNVGLGFKTPKEAIEGATAGSPSGSWEQDHLLA